MKAVRFHEQGGPGVLRYEDAPEPEPGAGEVLVAVGACGVNQLDVITRTGKTPAKIPLPHISGSEVAGRIARLGTGVEGWQPGERVVVAPYFFCGRCEYCRRGEDNFCLRGDILGLIGDGGFAEYVKVPASSLLPIPENLDDITAAALALAFPTAWRMVVKRAQVRPGEEVLVMAASGGVGSAAVQVAALCGARVIAAAGSDEKLERARELGAAAIINYNTQDLRQEVRRLTDRRGVDVVVENPGQATWERSVSALARDGRLVTCGAHTGVEGQINLWNLFARQNAILGSYGAGRDDLAQVLSLVSQGKLRAVVHRTYPLEQVADAQRALEERSHFGKLVIVVNSAQCTVHSGQ